MTRKPRGLRPDEKELWQRVASTTDPLRSEGFLPDALRPATPDKAVPEQPRPDIPEFRIGQSPPVAAPYDPASGATGQLIRMDRKEHQRMTRGKLKPESRIDLHGMTVARAHPALTRFILDARAHGKRLVLVITGKGKADHDAGPIPQRQGVLRHQVPLWLATPPLAAAVLQVTPAHQRHGGSGAYYVYLRRNR